MGQKIRGQQKKILTLLLILVVGSALLWGTYWLISYIKTPDMKVLNAQKEEMDQQFSILSNDLFRQEKLDMPTVDELAPYLRMVNRDVDLSGMIRQLQRLSILTGLELQSIVIGNSQSVSSELIQQINNFIQADTITLPELIQDIGEEEFLQLVSMPQTLYESNENENTWKLKQTTIQLEVAGTDTQLQNFLTRLKSLDRIIHINYVNFEKGNEIEAGSASIDITIYHYESDVLPPS